MPSEETQVLEDYFSSIERSYQQTLESQRKTDPVQVTRHVVGFLLVVSILPLLPAAISRVVYWVDKSTTIRVLGHQVALSSFWLWWVACICLLTPLFRVFIHWAGARAKRLRKTWLSEPQMRFACCYTIVKEVDKFETNRLQKHIDEAVENWKRLTRMVFSMVRPFTPADLLSDLGRMPLDRGDEWQREERMHIYPQFDILMRRFSWFRLDARSEAILRELDLLPSKLRDRLRDKKELDRVGSSLAMLSGYLYSQIPDVPSRQGARSLVEYGEKCLWAFTEQLSALAPYATEMKPVTPQIRFTKRVAILTQALAGLFAHRRVIVCFLAWYVLTQILTLAGLKLTLHFFPNIAIDSVIVALAVGSPLACGVSAVALSRPRDATDSSRLGGA